MVHGFRWAIVAFAFSAICSGAVDSAQAGMIIDMSNAPLAIGITFDGTTLSTVSPQNTRAVFTSFLDWYPDITTETASLIFGNITRSGPPIVSGTSILQQFSGGSLSLYDPAETLLLSGNLSNSVLSGTAGQSTGGLFTTSFSVVTGGVFAAYVDRPSLVFQMHFSNINGSSGLSTAPPTAPLLQPFTAKADANIDGVQVPEPATGVLSAVFFTLALASASFGKSRRP